MTDVLSTAPSAGEINVPLTQVVEIKFDEPMDPSTINELTILLYYGDNLIVPSGVNYSGSTQIAYLTPSTYLLPSTEYSVMIIGDFGGLGSGVRSIAGVGLASNYLFSFTTAPELPETSGLYVAKVEYWIDVTGTYGGGALCNPTDGTFDSDWESFYADVDISLLSNGEHYIYIHGQDSFDNWGAMQSIPFTVTPGQHQSSYTQSDYNPNYGGPFVFELTVTPTPTGAAPMLNLVGTATTRTAYWEPPVEPEVERIGYLQIQSVNPEDYDSQVSPYAPVTIIFNDNL